MATSKDILVTCYPGERDTEWEQSLIKRLDGKIEIRWQSNVMPDGNFRPPSEYDAELLKDATMLYTFSPLPFGMCLSQKQLSIRLFSWYQV